MHLTLNAGENDPGVVVGNDVSVAILWFVHLQVGVLPCELLPGVDGLEEMRKEVSSMHRVSLDRKSLAPRAFLWKKNRSHSGRF